MYHTVIHLEWITCMQSKISIGYQVNASQHQSWIWIKLWYYSHILNGCITDVWHLCRTYMLNPFSFSWHLKLQNKSFWHNTVTHLINISVRFDYHEWPVILNSMNLWFLRNYRMFYASVDDHNNVLLLVNQVASIENIISVRKHSLKSKNITFRKLICKR